MCDPRLGLGEPEVNLAMEWRRASRPCRALDRDCSSGSPWWEAARWCRLRRDASLRTHARGSALLTALAAMAVPAARPQVTA